MSRQLLWKHDKSGGNRCHPSSLQPKLNSPAEWSSSSSTGTDWGEIEFRGAAKFNGRNATGCDRSIGYGVPVILDKLEELTVPRSSGYGFSMGCSAPGVHEHTEGA